MRAPSSVFFTSQPITVPSQSTSAAQQTDGMISPRPLDPSSNWIDGDKEPTKIEASVLSLATEESPSSLRDCLKEPKQPPDLASTNANPQEHYHRASIKTNLDLAPEFSYATTNERGVDEDGNAINTKMIESEQLGKRHRSPFENEKDNFFKREGLDSCDSRRDFQDSRDLSRPFGLRFEERFVLVFRTLSELLIHESLTFFGI